VVSVAIDDLACVHIGDTIIIRLRDHYHQQAVDSLQENRVAVAEVLGGGLAGVKTPLQRTDVRIGAPVFVVERVTPEPTDCGANTTGALADEPAGDPPVAGT
jgi:hypothetical protein